MINKVFIREIIFTIIFAIVLSIAIKNYVIDSARVIGQSMEPSFLENDIVLLNKLNRTFNKGYKRGDVIVFQVYNDEFFIPEDLKSFMSEKSKEKNKKDKKKMKNKKFYIKRIIALPGEELSIKDNGVYIDGNLLEESYIPNEYKTLSYSVIERFIVPENEYFVLGDNRENSSDSRMIGTIKEEDIQGKIILRVYPINRLGKFNYKNPS